MENFALTINKSASKSIIKNLNDSARIAYDTLAAYAPQIKEAADKAEAAQMSVQPIICENMSKLAADKDGIKKAGFKSFEAFAKTVFGFDDKTAKTVSMYKRMGDLFYNVEKQPIVATWYTVSKLQELRNIPLETLDADAENGRLNPSMSQNELRAYADSKKLLEDGKTAVETTYDILGGDSNLTEAEILSSINNGILPEEDRVHIFTSFNKLVIPAKDEKHKDKEKTIKIACVEDDNGNINFVRYTKHDAAKLEKEHKEKPIFSKTQIAAMRAAGMSEELISAAIEAAKAK